MYKWDTDNFFFPLRIERSCWQLKFLLKNTLFPQVCKRHSSILRHYKSSSCHFFPNAIATAMPTKGPGEKNYALPTIKACLTITILTAYVLTQFKTSWKRGACHSSLLGINECSQYLETMFWYRCSVGKRVRQRFKGLRPAQFCWRFTDGFPAYPQLPSARHCFLTAIPVYT